MNELIPLNDHKLNRMCKELLNRAGEIPDANALYSLQLTRWVLENKPSALEEPAARHAGDLLRKTQELLSWKPEDAQAQLVTAGNSSRTALDEEYENLADATDDPDYPAFVGAALAGNLCDRTAQSGPPQPCFAPTQPPPDSIARSGGGGPQ